MAFKLNKICYQQVIFKMDKLTLSYEDLIKKYEKILTSTARGFETNYEFLEAWVPSENLAYSIADLFNAAKDYKIYELSVQLNMDQVKDLKNNKIFLSKIDKIGKCYFENSAINIKF